MKKYSYLLLCVLISLLSACQSAPKTAGKTVYVTIEPLRYVTEQIAGSDWQVISMVPAGVSPETYDPTPNQLVGLSDCQAYFAVGDLGFELQWLSRLQENAPNVHFYRTSEGIELLEGHHHHHHDGEEEDAEEEETGVDPHVWTTPRNLQQMAKQVCKAFQELDGEHAMDYQQRLEQLQEQINHTDAQIRAICQQGVQRHFGIYHPSLTYFAHDYDLEQVSIEEGGKEPSPAKLKELVDHCKEHGVKTIFIQMEFNTKNAEILAQEVGAQLVTINPLNYDWNQEMLHIIEALKP